MRYRILRAIITALFKIFTRWEVAGLENVPETGPYLLACNHLSRLDPPLVMASIPNARISALAAEKYERHPFFGPLLRAANAIFVQRGEVDRKALRACLNFLRQGGVLGVAPEGTRSPTRGLQKGKQGAAYLATRADVPILPVVTFGTEKVFEELKRLRRPRVKVVIGQPFRLPPTEGKARGAQLEEFTELIMHRLAELLPAEYRGVYA